MSTLSTVRRLHFTRSLHFQVIVVPAALSIISIGASWLHHIGWGLLATLLVAVVGLAYFWQSFRNEARQLSGVLADGEECSTHGGVLVTFVSLGPVVLLEDDASWRDSPIGFLVEHQQPVYVVLLCSEQSMPNANNFAGHLKKLHKRVDIAVVPAAEQGNVAFIEQMVSGLIRSARRAIGPDEDIVVDLTGGSSVFSVPLYLAAARNECYVTWIDGGKPNPGSPDHRTRRLVFDPSVHGRRVIADGDFEREVSVSA